MNALAVNQIDDDDDDEAPGADLIVAFEQYAEAGLRVPPVPHEMVEALREQDDWLYGTKDVEVDDREAFLAAAHAAGTAPYVAFGHTGHGEASWYLCYQLINGNLAVFTRQSYGGPYDEEDIARGAANRTIEAIEELVVHADEARDAGKLPADARLMIVIDDRDDSGWCILDKASVWHASASPIQDALVALGVG